jgi:HSP20 family protein
MADPLRELLAFQEKVNRLFDNALTRSELGRDPTAVGQWAPPTSVVETANALILEAELPGIAEKDIAITVTDHSIRIIGESRMSGDLQEGNYQRIERSYGNFHIDFPLHTPIDREQVKATYRRGVLQVSLPKLESTRSRQMRVQLNSNS